MRYRAGVRALGLVLLAGAAAALTVVLRRTPALEEEWVGLTVFCAAAVIALAGVNLELAAVAHRLGPGGIERVTPWGSRMLLRWPEVVALGWSGTLRAFELRTRQGERIRLSEQLESLDRFAALALREIQGTVLDGEPGLRARLESLAAGQTPSEPPRYDPFEV
jgi:hypothetical protein